MVEKPLPAAMGWLRQALGPVVFAPVVQFQHAAKALGMAPGRFRRLILEHNLPLTIDPVLGELLTVGNFYSLIAQLHPAYQKHRFDRQMFFSILSGLHSGEGGDPSEPMGYDERLEIEMARVAKLPAQERQIRGMEIYEAYKDARSLRQVADRIEQWPTPVAQRTAKVMRGYYEEKVIDNAHRTEKRREEQKLKMREIYKKRRESKAG